MRALADFELPAATRDRLRELMRARRPTDSAVITRDDIVGTQGAYTDLRQMHSGHGRVCRGAVDRSAWSDSRREHAAVYCVDAVCAIVPVLPGSPGNPGGPGTPPITAPVPETPAWMLLLAGLAALRPWRRRDTRRD